MNIPLVGQFVSLISDGLKTVFDYKTGKLQSELKKRGIELDEKKLEVVREVTEIEFQKFLLNNSLEIDKNFRGFVTEYEGAAKDVHPYVQILRAIIRPMITIWAVGIISYLLFANPEMIHSVAKNMELIPDKLWDIFFIVFAFWFGGRAVQHIIDKYTQGRANEKREVAKGDIEVAVEYTKREQIKQQASGKDLKPDTHFTEEEVYQAMPKARRIGGRRRF